MSPTGLRVLLLEPAGHTPGHHSYYTRRLAESLLDRDDVAAVTVVGFAPFLDRLPEREGLRLLLAREEPRVGARPPVEDRPHWAVATREAFARMLPEVPDHDVVHALDSRAESLAGRLWFRPALARKFIYLSQIGPMATILGPRRWPPHGVRNRLLFGSEAWLYRHVPTHTHSEAVAERIRAVAPRARVTVIPPGTDAAAGPLPSQGEARAALGVPAEGRALLVFGFQGPHKGVPLLLEALREVPEPVRLLIAGPPSAAGDVAATIREAGWADRTIFRLEYIPDPEVPLWFRAADVVLLAYPRMFIFDSGVMTRAVDYGTPVLATDVGHIGEMMRRYPMGETFAPEDAGSLRDALRRFLARDEAGLAEYRRHLARYADDHAWPRIAERHVALYRAVAGGGIAPVPLP